jgi:hypothetical protein
VTLPNFLIIGAAKSGTSSIFHYLQQHPDVFMPRLKEPRFFALEAQNLHFNGPGDAGATRFAITDLDEYKTLFKAGRDKKAIGEASPLYLYSTDAAGRIHKYIPHSRLIAILRNPVERAFSSYLHLRRDGREPIRDFNEALKAENDRIQKNWTLLWHYKTAGNYSKQLNRYFEYFQPEQLRVYLFEDLKNNPMALLKDIFGFLEIDSSFEPEIKLHHNVSGIPRSRKLHMFLTGTNQTKRLLKPLIPNRLRQRLVTNTKNRNLRKPHIPEETRSQLIEYFREDILELEKMLKRDLSHWLGV